MLDSWIDLEYIKSIGQFTGCVWGGREGDNWNTHHYVVWFLETISMSGFYESDVKKRIEVKTVSRVFYKTTQNEPKQAKQAKTS